MCFKCLLHSFYHFSRYRIITTIIFNNSWDIRFMINILFWKVVRNNGTDWKAWGKIGLSQDFRHITWDMYAIGTLKCRLQKNLQLLRALPLKVVAIPFHSSPRVKEQSKWPIEVATDDHQPRHLRRLIAIELCLRMTYPLNNHEWPNGWRLTENDHDHEWSASRNDRAIKETIMTDRLSRLMEKWRTPSVMNDLSLRWNNHEWPTSATDGELPRSWTTDVRKWPSRSSEWSRSPINLRDDPGHMIRSFMTDPSLPA